MQVTQQEADGDAVTDTDATLDGEVDTERIDVNVIDELVDRLADPESDGVNE